MILYCSSKSDFVNNVNNNQIVDILNDTMKEKMNHYVGESEKKSWENSLSYMNIAISKSSLPNDCTIILEYNLPISSSRIDMMITGYDFDNNEKVLIFELKQWSETAFVDDSDFLLETYVGNSLKKMVHPAYQVITYKELICDYNVYVENNNVKVVPCVVMHNYHEDEIITSNRFESFLKKVHMFYKDDFDNLVAFLTHSFRNGDKGEIIQRIDKSNLLPSKKLQDEVNELIHGNKVYELVDDQMVVYDELVRKIENSEKKVLIVEGGPGTGKSIIAINLLANLISNGKMAQYVSRNTAPRAVYSYKLKGSMKKTNIDNLFKSSGSYTSIANESFYCLIVDEAHCLTEKSGLFNNYGINQIKEIISSSQNAVFFVDEYQKVHLNDIGTISEIEKWANFFNRKIYRYSLKSQFRCNNSNDYLDFVDYLLGINKDFVGNIGIYDFKIYNSLSKLKEIIEKKSVEYNAKLIAGYCWDWNKKEINNIDYHDIKIGDFEISWNLGSKQTFAIDNSIDEAGCIHSVQGLDFDYVGIIIGPDLLYRDGRVVTDFHNHASTDPSFKGIKKLDKLSHEYANYVSDKLIKNTYRVLLTRGIKGCYVYCVDSNLNNYFESKLNELKDNKNMSEK